MEASIHLRRVIQEMRAEINRLEKENHALRVKLTSISQTTSSSGRESEGEREEAVCDQSSGSLPGDRPMNSAPAVQEYQGTEHMWFFWATFTFSSLSQMTGLLGYSNNIIIWYLQCSWSWVSLFSS